MWRHLTSESGGVKHETSCTELLTTHEPSIVFEDLSQINGYTLDKCNLVNKLKEPFEIDTLTIGGRHDLFMTWTDGGAIVYLRGQTTNYNHVIELIAW